MVYIKLWTHKAHISWINIETSDFSGKLIVTFEKVKINQIYPKLHPKSIIFWDVFNIMKIEHFTAQIDWKWGIFLLTVY